MLKDVAPLAKPAESGRPREHGLQRHRRRARAGPSRRDGDRDGDRDRATSPRLLGRTGEQRTPLQREVDRIGRMLGIAVIAIAVVVVGAILLTADIRTASDLVTVLLIGVSLAVAAVPEGLPAVLSVVLALGVQRMARRRAIVKKLSSVETLGSASVICSDKTGTLTKSEMTIQKIVTGSGEVDVTGSGYRPDGELLVDGRPLDDPVLLDEIRRRAHRRQPRERRRPARGSRRVDDPGRPHRGRVPRRRGEGRGADRGAPLAVRARRRGAVHLRAQADEHAPVRLGGRARRRGRHEGRARRAARPLHRRAGPRRGAAAHRRPAAARSWRPSSGSPTTRCGRSPSPTGRCLPASSPRKTSRSSASCVYLGMVGIIDPPRPEARARSPTRTPPACAC